MDPRESRVSGWLTYSGLVLVLGGIFALVQGLVAINKATFFASDAVFVFSNLNTWGWIITGLGVLGIVSGVAVFTGQAWARWAGVIVASLGALGQLMFAQAYPIWSLMIMGVFFLAIYGLVAVGGRESLAYSRSGRDEYSTDVSEPGSQSGVSDVNERSRRAA